MSGPPARVGGFPYQTTTRQHRVSPGGLIILLATYGGILYKNTAHANLPLPAGTGKHVPLQIWTLKRVNMGNKVLGARVTGDLRERFEAARPEEMKDSPFLREVIDDGLDAREKSVYTQVGCEGELRATVEEIRRAPEESREDVVVRLLREAVEARETDGIEKLADADLHDRVEALAEEGEPIDDAARRLLREAVEAKESTNQALSGRILNVAAILLIGIIPIANAARGDLYTAIAWVGFYGVLFEFGDEINNQFARVKGLTARVKP